MEETKYYFIEVVNHNNEIVVTDRILNTIELDYRKVFNIYTERIWNTCYTGDKEIRLGNEYENGNRIVVYRTKFE